MPSGEVLPALRRPWRDGTCAIVFSANELIEKLSALVPRPRINLLLYHGAFAPNARIRRHAVANALAQTQSAPPPGASDCASSQGSRTPPSCTASSPTSTTHGVPTAALVLLVTEMVGHLGLEGALGQRAGQLFQQAAGAQQVLRRLVVLQQLVPGDARQQLHKIPDRPWPPRN